MRGKLSASVSFERLEVDAASAAWDGLEIATTPTERAVLRELARVAPAPISREKLCTLVFGSAGGSQRIDVHISHLRAKLGWTGVRIPLGAPGGMYSLVQQGPAVCLAEDFAPLASALRVEIARAVSAVVDVMPTFAEARASVERGECDLVIADVLLPETGGSNASPARARPLGVEIAALAKAKGIPVILISGNERFAANAFELDVPFLLKPFKAQTLCALVHAALARAGVTRAAIAR